MSKTNAHKPGYKHTPLGWIPEEWEVLELEKCLVLSSGKTKPKDTSHQRDEVNRYPVYGGNGIVGFSSQYNYIGENIIIGRVGEYCGITRYVDESVWITDNALVTRQILRNIDAKYLTYKLQQEDISKLRNKGGQPLISQTPIYLYTIAITHSPLEQQRIAAILSTWDEAIQKTQQLIEQLKQRNKGLMQQLLKPHPEWKQFKLSDIFDRVTKKNTEGNKNVVTISAQRGFVRQDDFFNKLVASDILDNYFLVERGDFCYNKSYSKGYDWGATKRLKDFDKAVVTTLYICFRLKKTASHSGDFFEYFFESGILDKGLSKVAHEGGRAHGLLNVTPDDFFSLKVSLPDKTEQDRIFSVLRVADAELNLYQQQLTTLQVQKKGLMQKLLSGEVRVKTSKTKAL